MLNVSKIISLFTIILFSTSLYAVDVSKFDIDGIKLGMNGKKASRKMTCSNPQGHKNYVECCDNSSPIKYMQYNCESLPSYNIILVNPNDIIYSIEKHHVFSVEPNWNEIEVNVYKKFGKPTKIRKRQNYKSLCWGNCTEEQGNWDLLCKDNKSCLRVTLAPLYKSMTLKLLDKKLEGEMYKEGEFKLKEWKKSQKQKATNVSF